MRPLIIALAAVAALAACSKNDLDRTRHDVDNAGHDVARNARKIADSPDVAKVKTDVRRMGDQAKARLKTAAADARRSAHDLTKDGKAKG